MNKPGDEQPPSSQLILYQTGDRRTRINVLLSEEDVWLTQAQMAELFQTSVSNENSQLATACEDSELVENRTVKQYLIVRQNLEGVERAVRKLSRAEAKRGK